MEKLRKMLEEKWPNIDFDKEKKLIDDEVLDSVEVVDLIGELEEMFDISVSMEYIVPENFQSVETMWAMIQELA